MKNWFNKRIPTKDELYIKDIVTKFLEDVNVKKNIAPISKTVYLEDVSKGVYIKIHHINNRIDICDKTFLYKKDISSQLTDKLIRMVENTIEKEAQEINDKLFTQEMDLLRKLVRDEK